MWLDSMKGLKTPLRKLRESYRLALGKGVSADDMLGKQKTLSAPVPQSLIWS